MRIREGGSGQGQEQNKSQYCSLFFYVQRIKKAVNLTLLMSLLSLIYLFVILP